MSNFYTNRRYKEGLAGKKPSIISDKEGYEAQMRGYEQFLANEQLADRIADDEREEEERAERRRERREGGPYSRDYSAPSPPKPLTQTEIWVHRAIAAFLFWLDFLLASYIVTHPHPFPHNRIEVPDISANPFVLPYFIFLLIVFPGGLLFWPGLAMWWNTNDEKNAKK